MVEKFSFLPAVAGVKCIHGSFSFFQENLNKSKETLCALGSYLGMVDPWYNSNIRGLGCMIPKLAEMVQYNASNLQNLFLEKEKKVRFFVHCLFNELYLRVICLCVMVSRTMESMWPLFFAWAECRKLHNIFDCTENNKVDFVKPQQQRAEVRDKLRVN